MAVFADSWGDTHSADVVYQGQTLGMMIYVGSTRGRLRVETELRGPFLLAKLVDVSGFIKKRAQFHTNPSKGMLR
jgi:hypothetical protein